MIKAYVGVSELVAFACGKKFNCSLYYSRKLISIQINPDLWLLEKSTPDAATFAPRDTGSFWAAGLSMSPGLEKKASEKDQKVVIGPITTAELGEHWHVFTDEYGIKHFNENLSFVATLKPYDTHSADLDVKTDGWDCDPIGGEFVRFWPTKQHKNSFWITEDAFKTFREGGSFTGMTYENGPYDFELNLPDWAYDLTIREDGYAVAVPKPIEEGTLLTWATVDNGGRIEEGRTFYVYDKPDDQAYIATRIQMKDCLVVPCEEDKYGTKTLKVEPFKGRSCASLWVNSYGLDLFNEGREFWSRNIKVDNFDNEIEIDLRYEYEVAGAEIDDKPRNGKHIISYKLERKEVKNLYWTDQAGLNRHSNIDEDTLFASTRKSSEWPFPFILNRDVWTVVEQVEDGSLYKITKGPEKSAEPEAKEHEDGTVFWTDNAGLKMYDKCEEDLVIRTSPDIYMDKKLLVDFKKWDIESSSGLLRLKPKPVESTFWTDACGLDMYNKGHSGIVVSAKKTELMGCPIDIDFDSWEFCETSSRVLKISLRPKGPQQKFWTDEYGLNLYDTGSSLCVSPKRNDCHCKSIKIDFSKWKIYEEYDTGFRIKPIEDINPAKRFWTDVSGLKLYDDEKRLYLSIGKTLNHNQPLDVDLDQWEFCETSSSSLRISPKVGGHRSKFWTDTDGLELYEDKCSICISASKDDFHDKPIKIDFDEWRIYEEHDTGFRIKPIEEVKDEPDEEKGEDAEVHNVVWVSSGGLHHFQKGVRFWAYKKQGGDAIYQLTLAKEIWKVIKKESNRYLFSHRHRDIFGDLECKDIEHLSVVATGAGICMYVNKDQHENYRRDRQFSGSLGRRDSEKLNILVVAPFSEWQIVKWYVDEKSGLGNVEMCRRCSPPLEQEEKED